MGRTGTIIFCCAVPPLIVGLFIPLFGLGMGIGSMMVAGLFLGFSQIGGEYFWRFAETKFGGLLIAVLAFYVSHKMMGGHSIAAAIAGGWAFLCKGLVLAAMRENARLEKA